MKTNNVTDMFTYLQLLNNIIFLVILTWIFLEFQFKNDCMKWLAVINTWTANVKYMLLR